ncbi:DNA translocase FtsK [Hymenobacter sp. PAMC 26628]|uniref:DNA translocase FtsK n=1 Tax=Hymenobacter sp. PAMC 26628 TaxID=1484118 RepID=UPI000770285B|nr:DNA translocase FtsK [Hymenobacter sp. PAMC 26628]AMJ65380.1 hypothetical protein AXW84_08020 [Hymenobacter sp. PAMC 26628]
MARWLITFGALFNHRHVHPYPACPRLSRNPISEWEQRPGVAFAADPATRPLTLAQLLPLYELLLVVEDVNVDAGDARTTLADAASFGVATATASGPGRAARLVAALQFHHYGPTPAGPDCIGLLSITAHSDADLDMDELTFITEFVQNALGENFEMIFGHGYHDDSAASELRVHLLVGYGARAPAVFVRPTVIPNPLPDAGGRDASAEAARLLVRHQRGSSGLIQRELKLGYNRTCCIMQQLQQAGIIGASKAGQFPPVLITDETQLAQHLAGLPSLH